MLLHKEETHTHINYMALDPFLRCDLLHTHIHAHLIALTTGAARLAGLLSVDVMSRKEGVWRTLLALVGVFVDVVSNRAGDTG